MSGTVPGRPPRLLLRLLPWLLRLLWLKAPPRCRSSTRWLAALAWTEGGYLRHQRGEGRDVCRRVEGEGLVEESLLRVC